MEVLLFMSLFVVMLDQLFIFGFCKQKKENNKDKNHIAPYPVYFLVKKHTNMTSKKYQCAGDLAEVGGFCGELEKCAGKNTRRNAPNPGQMSNMGDFP